VRGRDYVPIDMTIRLGFIPRRILVLYWGPYGDTIVALPLIEALARGFKAHVCYVVGGTGKEGGERALHLLKNHPGISACWPDSLNVVRTLLCEDPFDIVIDLCDNSAGRFFSRLSGAKLRIWGKFREVPRRIFWARRREDGAWGRRASSAFTRTIPRADQFLKIARLLGIDVRGIGPSALHLTRAEKRKALEYSRKLKQGKKFLVAMHPGGTQPFRLWPKSRYAVLADRLTATGEVRVVVTRGPGEKSCADRLARMTQRPLPVIYKRNIREFLYVLAGCDVFVSSDGGPLHLALALGVPCVGLFTQLGVARYWYGLKQRGRLERVHLVSRKDRSSAREVARVFDRVMDCLGHEKSGV
jgi:ADP-heptose:LPS heptosyltransferase